MSVSIGARLGPYEILSRVGSGGMGEVYKARDTRLDRIVAVKISNERFSERFEREARTIASLNHPHICSLYDVGPDYLVMEFVDGPTLADRIAGGAMPLDEALAIARQIGDALEAAHEKGIVHRDLKPANVKLTGGDQVKVLDFGLAKALDQNPAADPDSSPTVTMAATDTGVILGTAAYMSPEQARGKAVDKRADIWAFGVVLYELITGRRLFEGDTVSDVLASVLTKEPDWSRVPAKIEPLLKSCLEKNPKQRLRDIGDAWRLLEISPPASRVSGSAGWKVAAAVLAVVSAVVLALLWRAPRALEPTRRESSRIDLDLGSNVVLPSSIGPAVIISPDGTRLVFVSNDAAGDSRLFTRRLQQPNASPLPGTEGSYSPFFSPDGQWVGFFAAGKLKKIRADGSELSVLCEAPAARGAAWGEDGNIIAALDQQAGLSLVPGDGGKTVTITNLRTEVGEFSHRWPQVLPGGSVLFTVGTRYSTFDDAAIAAVSLKDHRTTILLDHAGMYPRYVPSGHLLYVSKGALFAVAFDPERLQVRGPATRIAEVASNESVGGAQIDFSKTGTVVYRAGGAEALRTIQWLDARGETTSLGLDAAYYMYPRLSPDGGRIAYILKQGTNTELWVYDWRRGSKTRLATGQNAYPTWSADGRFIVYQSTGGMFWTRSDGSAKAEPLTQSKSLELPFSFSYDGTLLAFGALTPRSAAELRILRLAPVSNQLRAAESQIYMATSTINSSAAFSPDGKHIAYASAGGGIYEVYVRGYPDDGKQVQISNAGGVLPVWARDTQELFYRTEDQRIMAAGYKVQGDSFISEKPRVWFGKQLANVGLAVNFDIAADGKRAVVMMPAGASEPLEARSHIVLVTNFFDEVRRLARHQE